MTVNIITDPRIAEVTAAFDAELPKFIVSNGGNHPRPFWEPVQAHAAAIWIDVQTRKGDFHPQMLEHIETLSRHLTQNRKTLPTTYRHQAETACRVFAELVESAGGSPQATPGYMIAVKTAWTAISDPNRYHKKLIATAGGECKWSCDEGRPSGLISGGWYTTPIMRRFLWDNRTMEESIQRSIPLTLRIARYRQLTACISGKSRVRPTKKVLWVGDGKGLGDIYCRDKDVAVILKLTL